MDNLYRKNTIKFDIYPRDLRQRCLFLDTMGALPATEEKRERLQAASASKREILFAKSR